MLLRPQFPIVTERLHLRPFGDDDLDDLYAIHGHSDVARYLPWAARSREEVATQLATIKTMTGFDEESGSLRLAAIVRRTGSLVGDFSFWLRSREHRDGEIGYLVHPDHQGHGYATEGMRALLHLAFDIAGLHRVHASCDARNVPSYRVMEKLGMRREAHHVENEFLQGEWTDELVYAILDREWSAQG